MAKSKDAPKKAVGKGKTRSSKSAKPTVARRKAVSHKEKTVNCTDSKKTEDSDLSRPKPKEIISELSRTTSRVVKQAASILEEEIAAGVVAARQMEEHFINVDEIRAEDPDHVMQRFRKDTHEVVDIVIDVLNAAARYAGKMVKRSVTIDVGEEKDGTGSKASSPLPTIETMRPVKAGDSVLVTMTLRNEGKEAYKISAFHCTDLVSPEDARIPSKRIAFTPGSIRLKPGKPESVLIKVDIPKKAASGTYSGLIQAAKMEQIRAVLITHVN